MDRDSKHVSAIGEGAKFPLAAHDHPAILQRSNCPYVTKVLTESDIIEYQDILGQLGVSLVPLERAVAEAQDLSGSQSQFISAKEVIKRIARERVSGDHTPEQPSLESLSTAVRAMASEIIKCKGLQGHSLGKFTDIPLRFSGNLDSFLFESPGENVKSEELLSTAYYARVTEPFVSGGAEPSHERGPVPGVKLVQQALSDLIIDTVLTYYLGETKWFNIGLDVGFLAIYNGVVEACSHPNDQMYVGFLRKELANRESSLIQGIERVLARNYRQVS